MTSRLLKIAGSGRRTAGSSMRIAIIINRGSLSHTASRSQAQSNTAKNKFVPRGAWRYSRPDFDPPFADVRRRLLLVGRTQVREFPRSQNKSGISDIACKQLLRGEPKEESYMTSETEMEHFFARNCYTEAERNRVKAWHPYQAATEKNDIIEAQEIAMRVLERGLGIIATPPLRQPPANF